VISERLGHASVAFTLEVYAHLMPNMQQAAAAAMDEMLGPSDAASSSMPGQAIEASAEALATLDLESTGRDIGHDDLGGSGASEG
jgi:hypothetical protein